MDGARATRDRIHQSQHAGIGATQTKDHGSIRHPKRKSKTASRGNNNNNNNNNKEHDGDHKSGNQGRRISDRPMKATKLPRAGSNNNNKNKLSKSMPDWAIGSNTKELAKSKSPATISKSPKKMMKEKSSRSSKTGAFLGMEHDCKLTLENKRMHTRNNLFIAGFVSHNEIDSLGKIWRSVLRRIVLLSLDEVNALRFTRSLQLFLPFLTGYEAFILSQVIEAMDKVGRSKNNTKTSKYESEIALRQAFQNRNVSRILVQNMGLRYDFLWHWSTMVTWNRVFDGWGQLPFVGITSFPATENFPSTRNHALASIFRMILGPGNWPTRVVTRGREGLITDNPELTAQNLAAESNGFELANRNQFGTYFGRQKLNEFRLSHRLPIDESIVRTFVAQPMPTLVNNGVVHVLRQLAKHWHNMLKQENFSHQRMEQLDPFEALRFHIPEVLLVLSSLRGRNRWDSKVLGPMIRDLQALRPSSTADIARKLVRELQVTIAPSVCAGIPSLINPFRSWLGAIEMACNAIETEAAKVYELVSSVEKGIQLGYKVFTQVSWKVPSDLHLGRLILDHIDGKYIPPHTELRIRSALQLTTPRDKRTLIELVKNNLTETKPAKLLLGRVKTLLQRELRRERLNRCILQMSTGNDVSYPVHGEWYWLTEGAKQEVYMCDKVGSNDKARRFVHVNSGKEKFVSNLNRGVTLKTYLAVAEGISRAQKAFMTIELEHGQHFSYSSFMEFSYLRTLLQRLIVVSQITCEELDSARLNILKEMQRSCQYQVRVGDLLPGSLYYMYDSDTKTYEPFVHQKTSSQNENLGSKPIVLIPPQNITIIGGGPTGLMTTIHCAESVLVSGGTIHLCEARDSFVKGGSSFERAQIVRLDARWIATLRYHLGTGFEDVFIPSSGETDSQLGNTLPTQGFVEITIKDLESLLHAEVSRLWSKGLISMSADSQATYDSKTNRLTKLGMHLKVNDYIVRQVDEAGLPSSRNYTWRVVDLMYSEPLGLDDLQIGNEYGVYFRQQGSVLPFKLMKVCLESRNYTFLSRTEQAGNLEINAKNLPSIYANHANKHADVRALLVECTNYGSEGGKLRHELLMKAMKEEKFTLDVGNCHVVEAIGKPQGSDVHFQVTNSEPYGVLCMQGLKVSMGMHNFGGKRWGAGLLDDLRSQNDQNTRIIGDFTKMIRVMPIMSKMHETIATDENWRTHFEELLSKSSLMKLNSPTAIVDTIERACKWQAENASTCRRQTLQTRFFETGDNFYLGMEFPREYEHWKKKLTEHVVSLAKDVPADTDTPVKMDKLKSLLAHHLDRLWYESCLETIRTGDVYNPGARHRVPRLFLIQSYFETELGSLPVGESFRILRSPEERFEILVKKSSEVVVRNAHGLVSKLDPALKVKRDSNLTRAPDGNNESNVALATFPVCHYVNYRTMRLNDSHSGYVYTFIGDEQATPHFMRYSGLTGACINAMLLDNFLRQAIKGVPFVKRCATYSKMTNWSSGEVVQRGSGACFGEDGFLRPGFSYEHLVDYLYSRVVEHRESNQDLSKILTHDWTVKVAASLIPRGMELNTDFLLALRLYLRYAIFNRVFGEVRESWKIGRETLDWSLRQARTSEATTDAMNWDDVLETLDVSDEMKRYLTEWHIPLAKNLEIVCNKVIRYASKAYLYNERTSSELYNQPKAVDSILDDFAVEAQNFANSFVLAAALASAALAFRLVGTKAFNALSAVVSVLNIAISFDTMTNVARYKIRNEEARITFYDKKLAKIKHVFVSFMSSKTQRSIPEDLHPSIVEVGALVERFQKSARYYDYKESRELNQAFERFKTRPDERKEIRKFQRLLASRLIVDVYHVNSYLQEDLVSIYTALDFVLSHHTKDTDKKIADKDVRMAFNHLSRFSLRLDSSLQRGPIRWGFIKQRNLAHWDVTVVLRVLYSLVCRVLCIQSGRFAPIERATHHTVNVVKSFSVRSGNKVTLRREVRDLEELYWATRESDIASMIFLSSFLVFLASIVFTIARILNIETLEQLAFWATVPSTFGAMLAIHHLVRKLRILWNLWLVLRKKASLEKRHDDQVNLRKVRNVAMTQILLTFLRLGAATAAAVALPFSVCENGFGNKIDTPMMLPFWIALASLCIALFSTLFFFVVEYMVRYKLTPELPLSVVESFRDEINAMYWEFREPWNDVETKQVQERTTWEYVAREFLHKYRFDTVFAADRFGAILQYIQSGMETEARHDPKSAIISEYQGMCDLKPDELQNAAL